VSEELTDLAYVGPATAPILAAAGIDPAAIRDRRVSHAQLVDAGVNAGVAAKIRRHHSLSWSLEGGADLDRRAEQVRGLQDGEREWVARSASDWEERTADDRDSTAADDGTEWTRRPWPNGTDEQSDFEAEAQWRDRSRPRPLSDVTVLDEPDRERLAEAGITSVGSLATCNPATVAASLGIDGETVRRWRAAARDAEE
jgi:hypothetical protein